MSHCVRHLHEWSEQRGGAVEAAGWLRRRVGTIFLPCAAVEKKSSAWSRKKIGHDDRYWNGWGRLENFINCAALR